MKITFSITSFFDPFGDGKSQRKVLARNSAIADQHVILSNGINEVDLSQFINIVNKTFKS